MTQWFIRRFFDGDTNNMECKLIGRFSDKNIKMALITIFEHHFFIIIQTSKPYITSRQENQNHQVD